MVHQASIGEGSEASVDAEWLTAVEPFPGSHSIDGVDRPATGQVAFRGTAAAV